MTSEGAALMKGLDLPEVDGVHFLRPEPGDTVVCRLSRNVSEWDYQDVATRLKAHFPDNRVVIVDQSMTLEVLRKDGA